MKQMRLLAMSAAVLALLLGFTTIFQGMVSSSQQDSAVFETTRTIANTSVELTQFAILILGAAVVMVGLRELTEVL
jgi:Na+/alanine symporter